VSAGRLAEALPLAEALIARASVTPEDGGIQALLAARLEAAGFACTALPAGPEAFRVQNLLGVRHGARPGPMLAFAGHTDVVPPGPLERWASDPFVPTHREGRLHGRGAADMKASVAAMVVAAEAFVAAHPAHAGGIAFLLTSDEEGPSVDGTVRLVEHLRAHGPALQMCIVGEPTSVERLGDTMKNGRRGTLSGRLTVLGRQGHVAYPQLADNPIHRVAPALAALCAERWDAGNAHFPATSFQVSNVRAGTGAGNVIPGEAVLDFNFRFSTESTPEGLQARVHALLEAHRVPHRIEWTLGGRPFLTEPGPLVGALAASIEQHCGVAPELSTTGGTSDGRFIAAICPQVVEFGPVNASIHQVDEHVLAADVPRLAAVYLGVLERLLA
jgi:succinyl-diaminopimelate desuccinylase